MMINFALGVVGAGKTTWVAEWPKKNPGNPCVCFSPGNILRGALGPGFFNTEDGNSPKSCDQFVFSSFLQHVSLAHAVHYPVMNCDGWPRNPAQAVAAVEWQHRQGVRNYCFTAYHLTGPQELWEERMRRGRWHKQPELEQIDRIRFAKSLTDSIASVAMLRSMGVTIATLDQEESWAGALSAERK